MGNLILDVSVLGKTDNTILNESIANWSNHGRLEIHMLQAASGRSDLFTYREIVS